MPGATRYGRDPVVDGPGAAAPQPGQYPRAASTRLNVTSGLDVVGHTPSYDSGRNLWYSDVEISGAVGYGPFVRLSLARYQPVAVPGAELSSRVDLDPVRLGPARTAAVTRSGALLDVRLAGVEHAGIRDETNGNALLFNTVKVSFQQALPASRIPS